MSLTATGTSVSYLDTVHHRASLEGLTPGTRFFYRCGNPNPHLSATTGAGTGPPSLDVNVVGEGRREYEGEGERNLLSTGGNNGEGGGGGGESGSALGSEGSSSSETASAAAPGVRGARGGGGSGGAMELRDAAKWSSVFSFVTAPEPERWVPLWRGQAWRLVGSPDRSLIRPRIADSVP